MSVLIYGQTDMKLESAFRITVENETMIGNKVSERYLSKAYLVSVLMFNSKRGYCRFK